MSLNLSGGSSQAAHPGVSKIAVGFGRKVQAVCVVRSCVTAPRTASTAQAKKFLMLIRLAVLFRLLSAKGVVSSVLSEEDRKAHGR